MKKCWKLSPTERPRFNVLATILDKTLMSVAGYTELSMTLVEPTVTGEDDYEVMQPQEEGTNSEFKQSKGCLQRYTVFIICTVILCHFQIKMILAWIQTHVMEQGHLIMKDYTDLNTAYEMRTVQ